MFRPIKPWQNKRQRDLLRAAFHVDKTRAEAKAIEWFKNYRLTDATYPEHRHLVRLMVRFPDLIANLTETSLLQGLKRQLWVRGQMNQRLSQAMTSEFSEFGIDWMFIGSAQGFGVKEHPFVIENDFVEIIVPESAQSMASHLLKQKHWTLDWTAPSNAKGPKYLAYSHPKGGKLRLVDARHLCALSADAEKAYADLWTGRKEYQSGGENHWVPSSKSNHLITLARAAPSYNPNDQWVVDLFRNADMSIGFDDPYFGPQSFLKKLEAFVWKNFGLKAAREPPQSND